MEGSNKINMQDPFHIWSFSLYLWVTTLFEFHCFPQQINGSLLSKLSPSGLYDLLSCRSLTRNSYTHGKNERHKNHKNVHGGHVGGVLCGIIINKMNVKIKLCG